MGLYIRNNQVATGGEVFATEILEDRTETNLTLTDDFQDIDSSFEVSFTSDRTGAVEIYVQVYVEKTSTGSVAEIQMRLTDGTSLIDGTQKRVLEFHSSDGAQMLNMSWLFEITEDTSYTYRPQIRRSSSTETMQVSYGGSAPAALLKAIGL